MREKTIYNIHPSGGLLSMQFLQNLKHEQCKEKYIDYKTFSMKKDEINSSRELDERITKAWKALLERWDEISLQIKKYDISEARRRWILPLLRSFGYKPVYLKKDTSLPEDGFKLPLSHRGGDWDNAPILHTVLPSQELDEKIEKGRGIKSPHDSLQIYLNSSPEDLWGIVTNGIVFRILRRYYHTYTKGYIEFDLESIFEERSYSDFLALYRMAHPSRFLPSEDKISPLEHFYKKSLAAGEKIGDDLRKNVKAAIEVLANGFMNPEMANRFIVDQENCQEFYREILHVIYRIMFLMFAEQRGMLPSRNSLYADAYSMTRLRERTEKTRRFDRHFDAWKGLLVTFDIISKGVDEMKTFGYNGGLFDEKEIENLKKLDCENTHLLKAIKYLTFFTTKGIRQKISYVDLGVEEIGCIYENLLDFIPHVLPEEVEINDELYPAKKFFLDPRGAQRKSTGSYYTNPNLISELIKSALKPVLEDRLSQTDNSLKEKEKALLSIKVCDPATGSGAFLIAANNYLGLELAKIRKGTEYPPDREEQKAKRDVLQHCIYGVDVNPMAVELAKVSLWINACVEDMPLNFLDHHLKCGNSLIGTTPELIEKGISDNAFKTVKGEKKEISKEIIKRNKIQKKETILDRWLIKEPLSKIPITEFISLTDALEDEPQHVEEKREKYKRLITNLNYLHEKTIANVWTAAFFWPLINRQDEVPTQGIFRLICEKGKSAVSEDFMKKITDLTSEYCFFHWHLEFPGVFSGNNPGFDCILGNPPWEKVKLQEREFFLKDFFQSISNANERKKKIASLSETDPELYKKYIDAIDQSEKYGKFLRNSNLYPLTGKGDINTYQIFAELALNLIRTNGRIGIIVPSGIATDKTTKDFFGHIIMKKQLAFFHDFTNKYSIFKGVIGNVRFSLLGFVGNKIKCDKFAMSILNEDPSDLNNDKSYFISDEDVELLNPNTKTLPMSNRVKDIEVCLRIYKNNPILIRKIKGGTDNPWNVTYSRMFDMTLDSKLFIDYESLINNDFDLQRNGTFKKDNINYFPVYEGKLFVRYDYRHGSFENIPRSKRFGVKAEPYHPEIIQKKDIGYNIIPRYWVNYSDIINRLPNQRDIEGLFVFRNVCRAYTDARTTTSSLIPLSGVGNSAPVLFFRESNPITRVTNMILYTCIFNSFIFDYLVRQKLSGPNLNKYILDQIAVPKPELFLKEIIFENVKKMTMQWILESASKLMFNTKSMLPIFKPIGFTKPHIWNEDERINIECFIDAIIAHVYGISKEDYNYIISQFPILEKNEYKLFEEYRSKRLCLEFFNNIKEVNK